jgi:hypothetical protein
MEAMNDDDDMAPPPHDVFEIHRSVLGHGWAIHFDGHPAAFFSTGADLASWLKTVLTAEDIDAGVIPASQREEEMPRIFHEEPAKLVEPKPPSLWRRFNVVSGGKL